MTDQEGVIEEEEGDLGPNIWEEKGYFIILIVMKKKKKKKKKK